MLLFSSLLQWGTSLLKGLLTLFADPKLLIILFAIIAVHFYTQSTRLEDQLVGAISKIEEAEARGATADTASVKIIYRDRENAALLVAKEKEQEADDTIKEWAGCHIPQSELDRLRDTWKRGETQSSEGAVSFAVTLPAATRPAN